MATVLSTPGRRTLTLIAMQDDRSLPMECGTGSGQMETSRHLLNEQPCSSLPLMLFLLGSVTPGFGSGVSGSARKLDNTVSSEEKDPEE
jgi:hypothetical protein